MFSAVYLRLCLHEYMSYSKRDVEQGIISQSYDSRAPYHMRQDKILVVGSAGRCDQHISLYFFIA